MSEAYPTDLTRAQFEILSDLIPAAKSGGRPRSLDLWEVLNALFYLLCQGCRWRALPGDFPPWQTVYSCSRLWRNDGTWVKIHDTVREWVWIETNRQPSPSEACRDSQSVKTADGVSQEEGELRHRQEHQGAQGAARAGNGQAGKVSTASTRRARQGRVCPRSGWMAALRATRFCSG